MAHDHHVHDDGSGFSAGVLVGLVLLILVVAILLFYVGPVIFQGNIDVNVRSFLEGLPAAA